MNNSMIEILIVDDQRVVREQLSQYFTDLPDMRVIATAANGIEALEKIKTVKPDIVFMDVEMPGGISGLEMTSAITNLHPDIKVIILTGRYTEEYGQQAVQVGAEAYLPKSTSAEQLIAAVRRLSPATQLVPSVKAPPSNQGVTASIVSYFRPEEVVTSSSKTSEELVAEEVTPLYLDRQVNMEVEPEDKDKHDLGRFLTLGVLFNSLVWLLAVGYLKLTPPSYTSQWGVKILEIDSGVEVVLPDGGKATPAAGGWTPPSGQDPRNDYVYVATSPDLLASAAELANLSVEEYQPPQIEVDEENGIIAFEIEGSTPEEARNKALGFHQTMKQQIEELRQAELARQEEETQITLAQSKEKLVAAQAKLSEYRAKSGISTDEQIENLTDNIENLRRQKAELAAQQEGAENRYAQLSQDIGSLGDRGTEDAYRLIGDSVYQQYRTRYAQAQSSLTDLADRFTPSHPVVKNKQSELASIGRAMQQRGSQVVGRPLSLKALTRLDSLTLDPQNVLAREGLRQDLTNNRAEWQRLKAQNRELSVQIETLEARLRNMSQEQFQVDSLKRDLQVAETVFAATLAKLDLGQENIYSIYPPLQLVTQPNLPEKPSNPKPGAVLMGGLAGSFLVTTGLGLVWFDRQKFGFDGAIANSSLSSSPV
ncbi:MAG: response regulator [Cyanobacteria bacterium J06623_7]